jgi:hypothetical protein
MRRNILAQCVPYTPYQDSTTRIFYTTLVLDSRPPDFSTAGANSALIIEGNLREACSGRDQKQK